MSKAELVHDSWMTHISDKTQDKIANILELPEVQAVLHDLTVDKMIQFKTYLELEISWCSMNPKNKKKLEKLLNSQIQGYVDIFSLRNAIIELDNQGELHIVNGLEYPAEGNRLYRVELGRCFDDFDEFGNEQFREMRFTEVKIYRREDLIK